MIKLIKVNGDEMVLPSPLTLKKAQAAVGGYIQLLNINVKEYLICDEEGLLKKKLLNVKASKIAGHNIVGDVIVCGVREFK